MTDRENTADQHSGSEAENGASNAPKKRRIDWSDPNVSVGNAPPMPRWPVVAFLLAWLGWIVFLVAMLLSQSQSVTT